jgi:hypothetical protein
MGVKTNYISLLHGNRNEHHNTEMKIWRHDNNKNLIKIRGLTRSHMICKQFLLHLCHPSCYSCQESNNASWKRKEQDRAYDKRNISVVICDAIILFAPGFVNYKKGVLDSQSQVIKITSCLPMVGGSLRVLRLLPSLKLVTMI